MLYSVTEGAFSIGIPFKYQDEWRDDDYYVSKKYDNFEEEIREYDSKNFNFTIFKKEVLIKAKHYMDTQLIKSIPVAPLDIYGSSKDDKITKQHVISIILYCDYSELSSDFGTSHRKSSPFEPLSITKHRHQKYWWWSKLLLQSVHAHGIDNYFPRDLKGPFFTGMSFMMTLPQFHIKLLSPTSTSVHIEVAIKFSGQQGIILEFNNRFGMSQHTKAFDVSAISRFPEEDERYCSLWLCMFIFCFLFIFFSVYFYLDCLWVQRKPCISTVSG